MLIFFYNNRYLDTLQSLVFLRGYLIRLIDYLRSL